MKVSHYLDDINEKEMKISDLWKEYVKKYGKDKAAEKLMDILTGGTWAAWDGDKIKNFKKALIKKFSKYMKEGKLSEKKDEGKKKFKNQMLKDMEKEFKKKGMNFKKEMPNMYKMLAKEGKLNEAKETIFDVAAKVMKDKQNQNYKSKKGMVKVDMQSANLLMKVFKKVNPKMRKILSDLGDKNPAQLMQTLWAVVK